MKPKAERIAALIADKQQPFTDEDRTALEALTDAQLTTLEGQKRCERITALIAGTFPAPAKEVVKEVPRALTAAEFEAAMPADIRALVERAKASDAARKTELVTKLTVCQKLHNEEALKAMDLADLESMAALVQSVAPTVDFSAAGTRHASADNDVAPPPDLRAALDASTKK